MPKHKGSVSDMDEAATYLRALAMRMGLSEWKFHVDRGPGKKKYADIEISPGRRTASVRFFSPFFVASPEAQRATVVHELMHAHLNPILAVTDSVKCMLGSLAFGPFYEAVVSRLEDGIDAIAEAVAPLFPLPGNAQLAEANDRV